MESFMKVAVGIATAGRPLILAETLVELARQTRLPDILVVCPAVEIDFDATLAARLPYPLHVVEGPRGSSAQRNAILDTVQDFDVLMFFDDDFLAAPSYLAELEECFATHASVVAATGCVLADGIMGPGLDIAVARATLASFERPKADLPLVSRYSAYGCNMALRVAPIRAHGLRFDENLPLYGWSEDVDFCRQLAAYGLIVENARMAGVHLGVKAGRTSGVRFGYSQIANPYYLWRKGTDRPGFALRQIVRNVGANVAKSLSPEPWVDRRGRLFGNALGFADLIRGRLDPKRILELK
jgi:glycosyltransferase involved in cell wall biosynthesis